MSESPERPLPATLTQVYNTHFDFVWRNARRLGVTSFSADDVTQEVFIIVARRMHDYDGRASMKAWLFGILVRVVRSHRRSFRRRDARHVAIEHDGMVAAGLPPVMSPLERAEHSERARVVERLLAELDEDKRNLLILSELEDWSLREIAEFYGSNINTIHSRLRAAKRAFERAYRRTQAGDVDKKVLP